MFRMIRPMIYLKDEDLIKKVIDNQCNESLKELVNRHSGMIFNIGKKYCNNCNLDINELSDNKYWIIFNAINSYDPQKGSKFSTWLGNQVRFFCLNFKNKNSKLVPTEDSHLEFFINNSFKLENNTNKKETINNIIDLFHQISDPNTKNAIYYRYFFNKDRILNYSEIAEILKVTPQTVLNWHNKFIEFAKKKLTSFEKIDIIK
jgi:RNA polymerase sigma factor (sigma-70 family)